MTYTLFVNDYRLTTDTKEVLCDLLATVFTLKATTIESLLNGEVVKAKDGKQYEIVAWTC